MRQKFAYIYKCSSCSDIIRDKACVEGWERLGGDFFFLSSLGKGGGKRRGENERRERWSLVKVSEESESGAALQTYTRRVRAHPIYIVHPVKMLLRARERFAAAARRAIFFLLAPDDKRTIYIRPD